MSMSEHEHLIFYTFIILNPIFGNSHTTYMTYTTTMINTNKKETTVHTSSTISTINVSRRFELEMIILVVPLLLVLLAVLVVPVPVLAVLLLLRLPGMSAVGTTSGSSIFLKTEIRLTNSGLTPDIIKITNK